MSRFDQVPLNEESSKKLSSFHEVFSILEKKVEKELSFGRPKSIIFTHLDEAFFWVESAIREEQIKLNS